MSKNTKPFSRLGETDYKKPEKGTAQSKFTKKQIDDKLRHHKVIHGKEICKVPLGTWVRYANKKTGAFRVGGVLTLVSYPKYIVLKNPILQLSWSVQISDNQFYAPDSDTKEYEKQQKERVYKAYQRGKLAPTKKRTGNQRQ